MTSHPGRHPQSLTSFFSLAASIIFTGIIVTVIIITTGSHRAPTYQNGITTDSCIRMKVARIAF